MVGMLLTSGNVHNNFIQCHFVLHNKSQVDLARPSAVRTASNRPKNGAAGKLELNDLILKDYRSHWSRGLGRGFAAVSLLD
jgi:hypothetical protein